MTIIISPMKATLTIGPLMFLCNNPANALAILLSDSPPTQGLRGGWRRWQSRVPGPNLYIYLEKCSSLNQTLVSCAANSCYKECQLCVWVHVCACVDAQKCMHLTVRLCLTCWSWWGKDVFFFVRKAFSSHLCFLHLSHLLLTPFLSAFTFPNCVTKLSPGTHSYGPLSHSSPSSKHFPPYAGLFQTSAPGGSLDMNQENEVGGLTLLPKLQMTVSWDGTLWENT